MVAEHEYCFKGSQNRDFMVLALYLVYEHCKLADSFWWPYLESMGDLSLSANWNEDKYLNQIECPILLEEIRKYQKDYVEEREMLKKLVKIYTPAHFPAKGVSDELFEKCYAMVTSRSFGLGISSTLLVPGADMLNHADETMVTQEIINKRMQVSDNKIYLYEVDFSHEDCRATAPIYDESYCKTQIDVSSIFTHEEVEANPQLKGSKEIKPKNDM